MMMNSDTGPGDVSAMRAALEQAVKGIGLTAPNPPVGAVLVRDGEILGCGWHRKAGGPHAEIEALRSAAGAGHDPAGAEMFITLEPCSTHGRTPPCVGALISARLKRVVWGARDPNPAHLGRAASLLGAAGVEVLTGVLEEECQAILRPFAKRITTGLPWVIAKAGVSLDGRITRPAGEGQWLTGEAAREDAMRLRSRCEAILVGAGTIRADDPSLTIRGPALREGQAQPWRAVMTRSGALPENARIFTDAASDRTVVYAGQRFEEVLRDLGQRGVMSVLIEGGSQIQAEAFSGGWVDEIIWYTAPLISGSGLPVIHSGAFSGASIPLQFVDFQTVGVDLRIGALVRKVPVP